MPRRVGGQPISVPKNVPAAEPKTTTAAKGKAKAPVDAQQLGETKQAQEIAAPKPSVADTVRFVKQSMEQLDRQLLGLPFDQKTPLADSLRGFGPPPVGAEPIAAKTAEVFEAIEKQINALPPAERAQVFGVFKIPYNAADPNGETAKVTVAPPGLNAMNALQGNQNPNMMANANTAAVGQQGPDGKPLVPNALANQLPVTANPAMNGAQSQDLSDQGPSNPVSLLKEIVVGRLSFAGLERQTVMRPIDWQNPFGVLPDDGAPAATAGGGVDLYGAIDRGPPMPTLAQMSAGAISQIAAQGMSRQSLSALAQTLASDFMRAGSWGVSPQQFVANLQPLLDWMKLSAKVAPGQGGAALLFQARMNQVFQQGPSAQAFMQLAAELS